VSRGQPTNQPVAPPARRATADVVVVGAGIIGSCVAYELARRGAAVTVYDPRPGMGSSWGNAGMLTPSYCTPMSSFANLVESLHGLARSTPVVTLRRPLPTATLGWLVRFLAACRPGSERRRAKHVYQLATDSLARYDRMAADDGLELGLRHSGWLWTYRTSAALARAGRHAAGLRTIGVRADLLDGDQVADLQPGLTGPLAGGVLFPDEAQLDPAMAAASILAAARAHGAELVDERVEAFDSDGGAVAAVRGERTRTTAGYVVICTGAAAPHLGRLLGARIPVTPGYGWSLTIRTDEPPVRLPIMLADHHIAITPSRHGLRLTTGLEFGGWPDAPPDARRLALLRQRAETAVPCLEHLPPGTPWRGARPMTAAGLPVIGPIGPHSNVTFATGHGTLGVTLAPATAAVVAAAVLRHR